MAYNRPHGNRVAACAWQAPCKQMHERAAHQALARLPHRLQVRQVDVLDGGDAALELRSRSTTGRRARVRAEGMLEVVSTQRAVRQCIPAQASPPCNRPQQRQTWNTTLCAKVPLPDAMATSTWDSLMPSGGTEILVDRNRPPG